MIHGNNEQTDNDEIEKYCFLSEEDSCDIAGGLYQWDEVMQYSIDEGVQGICPSGWHVPTHDEFVTLTDNYPIEPGTELKIGGSSGFEAIFTGYRTPIGNMSDWDSFTMFWNSTEDPGDNTRAYKPTLSPGTDVSHGTNDKNYGFSVRCLKNY